MAFEIFSAARASVVIAQHPAVQASLLPILHDVQKHFGFVPEAVVPQIAKALNISRADVHGVVTFYHDYRCAAPGKTVIKLCRAEACQAMGGDAIADALSARLGVAFGETSKNGAVTLEAMYCLGLCACAPAAIINGELRGRLDFESVTDILAEVGL